MSSTTSRGLNASSSVSGLTTVPRHVNGVARLETALEGFDHFELSVNVGERYDRRRIQRRVGNLVNCFVSVIGYDDVLGMFHRGVGRHMDEPVLSPNPPNESVCEAS